MGKIEEFDYSFLIGCTNRDFDRYVDSGKLQVGGDYDVG